ncbi:glycosyltransferase family 2 protein [Candidatus Gottesmanbacteria bacterium]|nr:glycosyltransferase family 2 protein [Candidatus Gottesmanbacteria bacterium]
MIFLSIVIPAYNSENTIIPLLDSIKSSQKVNFHEIEIIVVDDKSKDETVNKVAKWQSGKVKKVKTIKLKTNQGPAKARNIGVKYAKGKVVLFLDADVVLYKNTLFEIVRSFQNDADLYALTGVWDKKQKSNKFFPKFKALRDWSYWINERDPKNYYYLFSTRIAAIDRGLFQRLGGFDTTYKAALVEDIELTYRIARRHAVVFNPKVMVHHEFEDFWPIVKKYFWRSFYWSRIYRERKKFDPVATTGKEAMTTVSAGGLVGLAIVSLLSYLSHLSDLGKIMAIGTGIMMIIHLFGVRKFLLFVAKEEGIVFAVKSFFTGLALYLVILSGALVSLISLLPVDMSSKN